MTAVSELRKRVLLFDLQSGLLSGPSDGKFVRTIEEFEDGLSRENPDEKFVFSSELADLGERDWARMQDNLAVYASRSRGRHPVDTAEDWLDARWQSDLHEVPAQLVARSTNQIESPRISLVVPFRDRVDSLSLMLAWLTRLQGTEDVELVLVDDGSANAIEAQVPDLLRSLPFAWTIWRMPGSGLFRAGIARNVGASRARGEFLVFVDSDFLLPEDFFAKVHAEFARGTGLLQARRWQIWRDDWQSGDDWQKTDERRLLAAMNERDEPNEFWRDFQTQTNDWNELPDAWKYVSTFCLAVRREDFLRLGGYRFWFTDYGFEDTDFGLRCRRSGLSFARLDCDVFHLASLSRDRALQTRVLSRARLRRSARKFLMMNLTFESMSWLGYLT